MSVSKARLLSGLIIALFCTGARADDAPAFVQWENGKPVTVVWTGTGDSIEIMRHDIDDGRKTYSSPFTVTENLCTQPIGAKCAFIYRVRMTNIYAKWTKNKADSSLVGKKVENGPLDDSIIVMGLRRSNSNEEIPRPELKCDDYRWIPGGTKTEPPARLRIDLLSVDLNTANPETNVTETRTAGGIYGLQLRRNSKGLLQVTDPGLDSVGYMTSLFIYLGSIIPAMNLTLEKNGSPCQISTAPGLGPDSSKYGSLNEDGKSSTVRPFIPGEDDKFEKVPLTAIGMPLQKAMQIFSISGEPNK